MIIEKPYYTAFIGLLLIIAIILGYLTIKYFYYQSKVENAVITYNSSVEKYYIVIEKQDSISKIDYNDIDFAYITVDVFPPENFGIDFKGYIVFLENQTNLINGIIRKLEYRNKDKDTNIKFNSIINDIPKTAKDPSIPESLIYTEDELMDIIDEVREEKQRIYEENRK